ncbi:Major sperm protein [Trichuris trichiura]|uniref:Major sperm protein n=1 Tax=Trichuris trichiura TaxID=36087 RepID=A0A077ZCB0_TRITR|nr:Major sperm protein [Trichuris trichiura]
MAVPTDIKTEPTREFWFNAPCTVDQVCSLRIVNPGQKPLGFRVKANNVPRYKFTPRVGQIPPQSDFILQVTCRAFTFDPSTTANDEISFEWMNAPEGVQRFDPDWFGGGFVIRKKTIKVNFNE